MTKLKPAIIPESESETLIQELHQKWVDGNESVRKAFNAQDVWIARVMIEDFVRDECSSTQQWKNEVYQVSVRQCGETAVHISIKRNDRKTIHDWRDLQEIKNQIVGEECEAVEIYPAESRRVDSANQYHLWASTNPEFRFPFGFNERLVTEESVGKSVNRPL